MFSFTDSPNHAGVIITGPIDDFQELYNACHYLLHLRDGVASAETDMHWLSLKMLNLCFDLRHTYPVFPGGEPPENLFANPFNPDAEINLDAFEHQVRFFWPNAIFYISMLNYYLAMDPISQSTKKLKNLDQRLEWAIVRKFQFQLIESLCDTVPENKQKGLRTLFHNKDTFVTPSYCTLYIDNANNDFIACTPERRLQQLPLIPSRFLNKVGTYADYEDYTLREAQLTGGKPWDFAIELDDLDDADW